jgi:pre-mRNA cleavage complex 2 protein Pcf11
MQNSFPPVPVQPYPSGLPYHSDASQAVSLDSKPLSQSATSPSTSAAPPSSNIANLLSTLLKAGVVSASGTPLGAGATAKEDIKQESVDLERESCRAYRQAILSQQIHLNSSDIAK